jgi:hypothetical protein
MKDLVMQLVFGVIVSSITVTCIAVLAHVRTDRRPPTNIEQRLDRIEADLDALKANVSATGIACQETRNRR